MKLWKSVRQVYPKKIFNEPFSGMATAGIENLPICRAEDRGEGDCGDMQRRGRKGSVRRSECQELQIHNC